MKRKQQPLQPIVIDEDGVVRFQANALVEHLVDCYDLHYLAKSAVGQAASRADWEQLYQLIGYSVSGFGGLQKVRRKTVERVDAKADRMRR